MTGPINQNVRQVVRHRHQPVVGRQDRHALPGDILFEQFFEHRLRRRSARKGDDGAAPRIERAFDDEGDVARDLVDVVGAERHQVAPLPQHLAGDDPARRHVDQLHHRLAHGQSGLHHFGGDAY